MINKFETDENPYNICLTSADVMFLSSTDDADEHGGELTKTITMFFTRKGRMDVRKRTEEGNENYRELTVN